MKQKQKIDLIIGIILILLSIIVLLLPIWRFTNVKFIFSGILIIYAIANFIKYFLTKKTKDIEGLLTTIVSILITVCLLTFDLTSKPLRLAFTLFAFVVLMSLIKINKADYYHDRRNKMWLLKIVNLVLFIISGFLASISLYYSSSVQVIVIGFFFLIHGALEVFDPIVIGYIRKK